MKKVLFISLAVILALSVSLIGCAGEGEGETPVVTLKVATYFSAGSAQVAMLEAFCNDLEAASAGLNTTIDTLRYWGGMPVAAGDLYDAAVSGSMDIIFVACLYEPGRFPIMDLFAQPLGIPHAW